MRLVPCVVLGCEIEAADCTQQGQIWTEGCASCQT
jgi:hypothetical protein